MFTMLILVVKKYRTVPVSVEKAWLVQNTDPRVGSS
jgi:hypothetical protein